MANALTAGNREIWSQDMQEIRLKGLMALQLADTRAEAVLRDGDTFNNPYPNRLHTSTYTKGSDISNRQDLSLTNEQLTITTASVVPAYLDSIDEIQNYYSVRRGWATRMQEALNREIDAKLLAEYANASHTVDAGDVGGSAGSTIALTTSNVADVFTAFHGKLDRYNVGADRFMVVSPSMLQTLRDYLGARDTQFGDRVSMNGEVDTFFGVKVFLSNNITTKARWTPADNPSADDTVTVAGVTFTFKTTPAAAGEVDIGAATANTLDNLVAAVNNATGYAAGAGDASDYFEISQANRAKLDHAVATDGTTYIDVEVIGGGDVVFAASESNDVWSAQTQHVLGGEVGSTHLVIQKNPGFEVVRDPDRFGYNLNAWTLYGYKTFLVGADGLADIQISASSLVNNSQA